MKKMKRILSMIGVVLLLSIYLMTFIGASMASPYSSALFQASIYCTIVVPIMLYVYMFVYKIIKKKNDESLDLENNTSDHYKK